MPTVFFLNRLREGVRAEDYEAWVRKFDYPNAKSLKSVKSYKVCKIGGALRGEKAYEYVETVEVTDLEEYRKELGSKDRKELHDQWVSYVGESVAVYGDPV